MSEIVGTYFTIIFTSTETQLEVMQIVMEGINVSFLMHKLIELDWASILEEIIATLFDISPNKSLGLDRFHLIFFQQC